MTMMKRHREKLIPTVIRTNDYYRLRHFWLMELVWLRAKRRNGTASKPDLKAAQRALVKVRKEEFRN